MKLKTCTKCRLAKELSEFHEQPNESDGRRAECKACLRRRDKKYYGQHREQVIERERARTLAYPERAAYINHKAGSKRRGIAFLLSIEEWIEWWGDDFELRGKGADDLCMGRFDDSGSYELGNIYKTTNSENGAGPRPLPVQPC